jgi:hypothetical protein
LWGTRLTRGCGRREQYTALLPELLASTPKSFSDYGDLQKAIELLNNVSVKIKENVSVRKNLDVILNLEKKFVGNPGFSKPGRYIVRQGVERSPLSCARVRIVC